MQRCLLVGGAGFIGSNLAKCLYKYGYDVTIFDLASGMQRIQGISGAKCIEGNYFENGIPDEIIEQQDTIFLLACSVGPQTSMMEPQNCYQQDVVCMIKLLEQMRRYQVKRLVLISSGGTIYGNHSEKKLSEDMDTSPINHYGIMKLAQEKILMMYNQLYKMRNVGFRLANPYGPGQREASGIGAVTNFLYKILNDEKICLFGTGENVRDYIYIDDVSEMIYRYLRSDCHDENRAIYNIGTGQGESLLTVIKIIERITGKEAHIVYEKERDFDVISNILETKKIEKVIGNYRRRSIEIGIKQYIKDLESNC